MCFHSRIVAMAQNYNHATTGMFQQHLIDKWCCDYTVTNHMCYWGCTTFWGYSFAFLPIASRSSASLEGFSSLNWGRDWELKGTADQWPAGEIRSLPDGLLQGFWCAWPQGDFDKPKWPFASEVNFRSSHLVAAKKEAFPERVQTNTSLAHHHM